MNSRKNPNRTLSFQPLEDRKLMTGTLISNLPVPLVTKQLLTPNVTTSVSSKGVLTITGNNANDQIAITQTAANEFTITGLNGTTVNGTHTTENFPGVTSDVNINFTGDINKTESVTIGNGSTVRFGANLNVNLGNSSNTFNMSNATVVGAMSLTGGTGHDFDMITKSTIGTASSGHTNTNDLNINLGGGANDLVIENGVFVQRDLNINDGSSASDYIFMGGGVSAGRNMVIDTGAGADQVILSGVSVQNTLSVNTGAGNDTVSLGVESNNQVNPVYADECFINLGAGNDTLQYGVNGQGGLKGGFGSFDGGAGTDTFINGTGQSPSGSLSNFESYQ